MSWKMIGEPKVRKATRTLAEEFAGMTASPHDRPLNATRAGVIRVAFEKEKFRTCEWATAYCEQTKQTYRINGKHTSTVLASMNGEFPKNLSVIVESYKCDTLEDVASLYSTFDTRASVRSTGDINMIYAAICDSLSDVSSRIINFTVSGVAYAIWEDGMHSRSAEERAQLIVSHDDFCLWFNGIMTGTDGSSVNHIKRAAVVAAMLKAWQKSKSAATEFWVAVRDETGNKPDCPDRKLAKFLQTSRIAMSSSTSATRAGRRETFVKCLHAWNAWRSGEATGLKFYPNSKTPAAK